MESSKNGINPARSATPSTSGPRGETPLKELAEWMAEDALEALRKAARERAAGNPPVHRPKPR